MPRRQPCEGKPQVDGIPLRVVPASFAFDGGRLHTRQAQGSTAAPNMPRPLMVDSAHPAFRAAPTGSFGIEAPYILDRRRAMEAPIQGAFSGDNKTGAPQLRAVQDKPTLLPPGAGLSVQGLPCQDTVLKHQGKTTSRGFDPNVTSPLPWICKRPDQSGKRRAGSSCRPQHENRSRCPESQAHSTLPPIRPPRRRPVASWITSSRLLPRRLPCSSPDAHDRSRLEWAKEKRPSYTLTDPDRSSVPESTDAAWWFFCRARRRRATWIRPAGSGPEREILPERATTPFRPSRRAVDLERRRRPFQGQATLSGVMGCCTPVCGQNHLTGGLFPGNGARFFKRT